MVKLMVHPEDVDESIRIQKAAFAAGYRWGSCHRELDRRTLYWITIRPEEKTLRQSCTFEFFAKWTFTEKTVPEILRMLGANRDIDCTIPERGL